MTYRVRLIVLFLVLLVISAGAQPRQEARAWEFQLPHGSLRIGVQVDSSGSIALSIGPNGQTGEAPIDEQVEPLKRVLAELPELGLDPRNLAYIGTHIFDETLMRKLAYACADSAEWQSSMQAGGKGKEKLVIALLNQSGAYQPFNQVFKQYGIQVRVTEAEKVGLMRFSRVPPRDARDRAKGRLLVPADAMLGMRFSAIEEK